jgi:DNA-binding MarR family transcriptional regulator
MEPLTDQQEKVLATVEDYVTRNGFPPTLREIGDALGLANVNAVRGHVSALEKKGYITKEPEKARSIRVVHSPSGLSRFKRKLHEVFGTDAGVFHRIIYGIAWTTWRRTPSFTGPRRAWLEEVLRREAVERGWRLLDLRIRPDLVVLVVEAWPNHSAELTVRRFRAAGQKTVARRGGGFPGGKFWAKGYVATTDLALLDELVARLLAGDSETP